MSVFYDMQGETFGFRATAINGSTKKKVEFLLNSSVFGCYDDVVWNPAWVLAVTFGDSMTLEINKGTTG